MKKDILEESFEFVKNNRGVDYDEVQQVHEMKVREEELARSKKFKPDWNLLLNGVLSLTTIVLVMNYEKENVISSKPWSIASKWIGKGR